MELSNWNESGFAVVGSCVVLIGIYGVWKFVFGKICEAYEKHIEACANIVPSEEVQQLLLKDQLAKNR